MENPIVSGVDDLHFVVRENEVEERGRCDLQASRSMKHTSHFVCGRVGKAHRITCPHQSDSELALEGATLATLELPLFCELLALLTLVLCAGLDVTPVTPCFFR